MECSGLHAVVVSRFLYDCAYFGKEVMAMIDAVIGSGKSTAPLIPQALAYRSIFEVGTLFALGDILVAAVQTNL